MSKNICYSNHQIATWIKTVLVALIALVAIGIKQTGETQKMDQYFGGSLTQPYQAPGLLPLPAPSAGVLQLSQDQINSYTNPAISDLKGNPVDLSGYTLGGPGITAVEGATDTPAQRQLAAQQSSARNSFNQGKSNILGDIMNSGNNYLQTGRNNILDFINGLKTNQQGLDTQRSNAVLGKNQSLGGIQNMVGQGIRSFGVNLANRNASDSSAALAGAQAYGRMGNQQSQDVNQQYGLTNANLDVAQQGLDTGRESGLRKFDTEKEQTINNLTNYAQQQFATLNSQAEGAGIMDRIAIEQEKENIKNQLIQQLAELDARGQAATVNPMDQMAVQNKAAQLGQLGQGGTQFDFGMASPAQLQTGAQISQLPIYSNRRKVA